MMKKPASDAWCLCLSKLPQIVCLDPTTNKAWSCSPKAWLICLQRSTVKRFFQCWRQTLTESRQERQATGQQANRKKAAPPVQTKAAPIVQTKSALKALLSSSKADSNAYQHVSFLC